MSESTTRLQFIVDSEIARKVAARQGTESISATGGRLLQQYFELIGAGRVELKSAITSDELNFLMDCAPSIGPASVEHFKDCVANAEVANAEKGVIPWKISAAELQKKLKKMSPIGGAALVDLAERYANAAATGLKIDRSALLED